MAEHVLPVKCLLVDDLQENLYALSALLERDDVEVLQARSGTEALEMLLVHEVALALLDVQMPDMDGFELAELMRGAERTRHVPIIFVTAGVRDPHRLFKGYDSGAVDFLYKPIEPHVLRNKASVFFQLYRQKQQLAQELSLRTETLRLYEMFTAVLGHDLRSPLSAILTSAQLLQYLTPDPQVHATADRIVSSSRRMSRMIDDTLDLARARLADGIPLERSATDFGVLLQRVIGEAAAAWPQGRIESVQHGDVHGEWDAGRLAQVAANLIGNALRHGRKGTPVEVVLDGSAPDQVELRVANAGTIPADILPQIFDPFRSGQRQLGGTEGLGLGLYIVQQIVHAHGGEVTVESGTDDRTEFRVMVPRRAG